MTMDNDRPSQDTDFKPMAVRELFDGRDLTLKTETPPRMVMPLVRLRMLQAAANPRRQQGLIEVFVEEFDRRMISIGRKGRLEILAAMNATADNSAEDEAMF